MTSTMCRRATGSAVLVLALTSLAACGDTDTDEPSSEPTSSSSEPASTSTDGAAPSEPGSSDADPTGDETSISDFVDAYASALEKATTAHIEITVAGGAAGSTIDGVADFGTNPPSFQMNIEDPTTDKVQTLVLADGGIYVPSGKGRYFKTDLSNAPFGTSGVDLFDPESAVAFFKKGIKTVALTSGEQVDGEAFDHYTIAVDSQAILGEVDPQGEAPSSGIPDELTYDIYLDADGLLRKVTIDDLGAQAGGVEVTYDQWGDPVDIAVPDPSKVDALPGG